MTSTTRHRGKLPTGTTAEEHIVLSPKQLATQLGIPVDELRRLRKTGNGPAYITITPRTIRYLSDDVDTWRETTNRDAQERTR